MKRFQLFEFTDLPWWPRALRNSLTDFLEVLLLISRPFGPKTAMLSEIMKITQQTRFIDLCSGSGGPWLNLIEDLRKQSGENISVVLTDKYPNPEISNKLAPDSGITYFSRSIDVLAVPKELDGIRTLFNGFHHFPPDIAAAIIQDAVKNNQPIVIFEMLNRSWLDFFYFLLTPINVWLLTPLIRPVTIKRFLLTYIIPIAPFVITWDSIVSIMRCYTPKELLVMAHQADSKRYVWEAGYYRRRGLPVTYLIGHPIRQ
jgi:hypothetical protein